MLAPPPVGLPTSTVVDTCRRIEQRALKLRQLIEVSMPEAVFRMLWESWFTILRLPLVSPAVEARVIKRLMAVSLQKSSVACSIIDEAISSLQWAMKGHVQNAMDVLTFLQENYSNRARVSFLLLHQRCANLPARRFENPANPACQSSGNQQQPSMDAAAQQPEPSLSLGTGLLPTHEMGSHEMGSHEMGSHEMGEMGAQRKRPRDDGGPDDELNDDLEQSLEQSLEQAGAPYDADTLLEV